MCDKLHVKYWTYYICCTVNCASVQHDKNSPQFYYLELTTQYILPSGSAGNGILTAKPLHSGLQTASHLLFWMIFLLVFHISNISTITFTCGSCIGNRQRRPIQCDLCWLVKSGSWAELVVYTLCTFLATCRWKRLQDCRRFQIRIM